MISPTRTDYVDRTRDGQNVPVRTTISADLETPVSVYLKLKRFMSDQAGGSAFLFESVERGVQTSSGHYYAARVLDGLGVDPDRGVVRLSFVHYTSPGDVARAVDALGDVLGPS